jgi:hypothetical protein
MKKGPLVYMLTIFSVPKPFTGLISIIQRNAIRSWMALGKEVEIILIGDEYGIAEICWEYKLKHIPNVERNRFGTPKVSSAFDLAQDAANSSAMLFVNADIILSQDILVPLNGIPFSQFLISCRRWDLDVQSELHFNSSDWNIQFRKRAETKGRLHEPTGMDCFIFPRGQYRDLPPFGIGRAGWDSWLVYWTRSRKIPVVDATEAVRIFHQNHDYSHLPMGMKEAHAGAQVEWHLQLAGGIDYMFTLEDADWVLTPRGYLPAPWSAHRLWRWFRALRALHPSFGAFLGPIFTVGRAVKRMIGK